MGRGTAWLITTKTGFETALEPSRQVAPSCLLDVPRYWLRGSGDPVSSVLTGRRPNLSGLIKRSFSLAGHRTSVALEAAFWDVLDEIARSRGMSLGGLVTSVDFGREGMTSLASSLRVLALQEALSRVNRVSPAPPDP